MPTAWKKITKEIDRKVLVTNNHKARDAKDQRSHIWVARFVNKSRKYGFTTMTDCDTLVTDLTHYADIPE